MTPERTPKGPRASRILPLILPSLTDVFFAGLVLWMFSTNLGWSGLLQDGDTGWHIRTGEYILDHGWPPCRDLFSFSRPGAEWFAWEWLTDVLYALLFRTIGLKGIVFFSGLLICGTATVLLRHMLWRGANALVALAVALMTLAACAVHYHARPHLFTLLLLAISAWLIDADRRSPGRRIWLLLPLTVLWTNLHGGFLVLIASLGLTAAGSVVQTFTGRRGDWSMPVRYATLTAGCALMSLINPYGVRLHLHVAAYLRSDWIHNAIQEFQSPSFRSGNMMYFEAFLIAGIAAAGFLLARRQWTEAFTLVYFAHSALSATRHVPLFVILSAPLVASELTAWWERMAAGRSKKSVPTILTQLSHDLSNGFRTLSLWSTLAVLPLSFAGDPAKWPQDFPDKFPIKMTEKYREKLAGSRVLTTDQWGDYLIFKSHARQKVFIDGRSDFYGEELGREYLALMNAEHNWSKLLDRYAFDVVLAPVNWPLATVLKMSSSWRVVDDDRTSILFERVRPDSRLAGLMKKPGAAEKY